jgi:Ribosomal protein L4/L1 family
VFVVVEPIALARVRGDVLPLSFGFELFMQRDCVPGAFGNMCRGGRMFAPTKTWRRWHRKINITQRRYAIASAIAATGVPALIMARGHIIDQIPEVPLVVSDAVRCCFDCGIRCDRNLKVNFSSGRSRASRRPRMLLLSCAASALGVIF